jgi:mRNA-degrading endonuclease YafQ of YafQ-DinJ toxin-antitoxin module
MNCQKYNVTYSLPLGYDTEETSQPLKVKAQGSFKMLGTTYTVMHCHISKNVILIYTAVKMSRLAMSHIM